MKQNISALELIPKGDGSFEVDIDGKRIYSKLEVGEFPDEENIVSQIESMR